MMPDWLRVGDPDGEHPIRRLRRRYTWGFDRKPLILSEGTRWAEPFTVELALEWAERLAAEELA